MPYRKKPFRTHTGLRHSTAFIHTDEKGSVAKSSREALGKIKQYERSRQVPAVLELRKGVR